MELGLILQRRDKYMSSQRTQVWKRKFSNIGKVGFRMLRKYRRCRGIVYRSFVTRRTVHEPAIVEFWGRRTLIHSNRSSFRSYRLAWSMSAWMQPFGCQCSEWFARTRIFAASPEPSPVAIEISRLNLAQPSVPDQEVRIRMLPSPWMLHTSAISTWSDYRFGDARSISRHNAVGDTGRGLPMISESIRHPPMPQQRSSILDRAID